MLALKNCCECQKNVRKKPQYSSDQRIQSERKKKLKQAGLKHTKLLKRKQISNDEIN